MRTTVTLDADVVRLLEQAMQAHGQSFKQVLNQAVRRGLADVISQTVEPPFEYEARPMGLRAGIDPARLNALADELEAEAFADLAVRNAARRVAEP